MFLGNNGQIALPSRRPIDEKLSHGGPPISPNILCWSKYFVLNLPGSMWQTSSQRTVASESNRCDTLLAKVLTNSGCFSMATMVLNRPVLSNDRSSAPAPVKREIIWIKLFGEGRRNDATLIQIGYVFALGELGVLLH